MTSYFSRRITLSYSHNPINERSLDESEESLGESKRNGGESQEFYSIHPKPNKCLGQMTKIPGSPYMLMKNIKFNLLASCFQKIQLLQISIISYIIKVLEKWKWQHSWFKYIICWDLGYIKVGSKVYQNIY